MKILPKMFTEDPVRKALKEVLKTHTQAALAALAGVQPSFVSQCVRGTPITGNLAAYLGFEECDGKFYRKINRSNR